MVVGDIAAPEVAVRALGASPLLKRKKRSFEDWVILLFQSEERKKKKFKLNQRLWSIKGRGVGQKKVRCLFSMCNLHFPPFFSSHRSTDRVRTTGFSRTRSKSPSNVTICYKCIFSSLQKREGSINYLECCCSMVTTLSIIKVQHFRRSIQCPNPGISPRPARQLEV